MKTDKEKFIVVGRFGAPFGVKGWLKIHSFTVPIENILEYHPWYADLKTGLTKVNMLASRRHHKEIVVQIEGCESKEATVQYRNINIAVRRSELPELQPDEYYWSDLEGLSVCSVNGVELGKVDYVLATGANDILVVKGEKEHLIPFLQGDVIKMVDLIQKKIIVDLADWDPEC